MSTYRDETYLIFDALFHSHLEMSERNGSIILTIPDEEFQAILPQKTYRTEMVLTRIMRRGETRKELAGRLNTDPSTLSAATSQTRSRRLPRNVVLASLLWLDPIPTPDEANHLLMELIQPGLFFHTYIMAENRRNWLLYQILTYAQTHSCPVESWLDFANHILAYCDQELIHTPKYRFRPTESLSPDLYSLADRWNREADKLAPIDFSINRLKYLDRFRQSRNLLGYGSRQEVFHLLNTLTNAGSSVISDMFGRLTNKNSNVARDKLIPIAAAMGCTYREVNQLLMEGNRALLYPNNSNEEELTWIKKMRKDSCSISDWHISK